MATDVLVLGDFVFDDWSSPDRLPFGGKQAHSIQRMPGGARTVDLWGPDDCERAFSARFWGADALDNALTLDAMRSQGAELAYTNGIEARTVIIAEFLPLVVKMPQYVEFGIVLVTTDDSGTGTGAGLSLPSLDLTVGNDLSAAIGLLP